jgi:hypothetical protein
MTGRVQTMLAALVVVLGIGLMIGGIVTHRYGGVVVGLIAAAAAARRLMAKGTRPV